MLSIGKSFGVSTEDVSLKEESFTTVTSCNMVLHLCLSRILYAWLLFFAISKSLIGISELTVKQLWQFHLIILILYFFLLRSTVLNVLLMLISLRTERVLLYLLQGL